MVSDSGHSIGNIDVTVVCESPRLAPFRSAMAAQVAAALDVAPALISLKSSTSDKMGFLGRGEGIAALAVALVHEPRDQINEGSD